MRLELEQNHSSVTFAENADVENSQETRAAEAAEHLREGIKAAQSGNRAAARTALLRAAEIDPRSESAWLWLSSISEYPEELLVFLTNVLEINPLNARALEWSAATRSLLAKNFVQRGIDAAEASQQDTAVLHFNQALEYDEKNSMAWLWLASLSDSNEGKLTYLEKVLEFEPENETAKAGYEAARNSIRTKLLAEARAAAVAGNAAEADDLLNAIIAEEPNAEDAWVLRSHLANGFDAKIAAFKRILEINPDNAGAKAGLESLTSIMDAVAASEPAQVEQVTAPEAVETADEVAEAEQVGEPVEVHEEEAKFEEAETVEEFAQVEEVEETVWEPVDDFETVETADVESSPFDSFAEESPEEFDEEVAEALTAFNEMPKAQEPEQLHEEEMTVEAASEEEVQTLDDVSAEDEVEPHVEVSAETEEVTSFDDAPAISAPVENPFETEAFKNEKDEFATVVSTDIAAETRAAIESLNLPQPALSDSNGHDNGFNVPFDMTMYGGGKIPMPSGDFDQPDTFEATGFETRVFVEQAGGDAKTVSATAPCSFCNAENDIQAIACQGCLSVLTLADLELILANHHADKAVLRQAVEKMESEKATREFTEAELTTLGIGHLNLRNLQYGYNYLHEASLKNPNNVVLSGQVNALLIRLDEIKKQDEAHESMSKGKTILVVDDSPTVRKLIAGKLEKCGHQVVCSSDGVEAMVQLEGMRPDLVLLDITMPRMDGYQVCKLIRSNVATKDVPVVMISGKDGFFDKVRGRMAGTSGYITKPFGPETLMKAVESYLKAEHVAEV